jgi:hypothetical protein
MSRDIAERDWKVFKELLPVASFRYCQHILDRTVEIATSGQGDSYERCDEIAKLMREMREEQRDWFSDFRRSTALIQILGIRRLGWFTDTEFARFSGEVQELYAGGPSSRAEGQ